MRRRALFILGIVLLASLTMPACVRRLVGEPIREENIPKIAIGKTKRDEIFKLFGTPYRVESRGDEEILTYLHGRESTWSVGLYSEIEQKADILTIYMDQKGTVSNYTFDKGVATPDIYKRPILGPGY